MLSSPLTLAPLLRPVLIVCLFLALAACAAVPPRPAATTTAPAQSTVILVSIDGFRPDYLKRGLTPRLAALAEQGVQAPLRPSFPTLTFPNHYTLVTGLYPDHHGIVHNRIEDADDGSRFVYKDATTTADPRWWGGEPIWVGAERHGLRTATLFWPGSDAPIAGLRPSYWKPFDRNLLPQDRVDTLLGWLDLPEQQRPRFLTLYFEQVDRAGHDFGPESREVDEQLAIVDAALGRLFDGLAARELTASTNLVVVSDHGQVASSRERVIEMDGLVDLDRVRPVNFGVVAGFAPLPGQDDYARSRLLRPHAHMHCWRKQHIPQRLHYGSHPRIPPIVCLAAEGWIISNREWLANNGDDIARGEHGYDNALPSMRALFIAAGPAFRRGARAAEFNNVDVYPLLAHLLGIPAAPNDGDGQTMRRLLKAP